MSESASSFEHKAAAQQITPRCAVLTLSDTRTPETDTSGQTIERLLTEAGAIVVERALIKDEPAALQTVLTNWLTRTDVDLIITTGGTGLSRRDQTVDVVEKHFDRPLPGFGELFRMLSWEQVCSAALLSRATAGTAGEKMIFALPGSKAAVELATKRLIIPEMRHLLRELRK
ncbi:MAG TPA: MogA/MoaB family molybdenum cofactor biosynthesis protein [Tepidisphaeraceae bacterium]|jgi:molybdenum cofactor biosynthesis protein B